MFVQHFLFDQMLESLLLNKHYDTTNNSVWRSNVAMFCRSANKFVSWGVPKTFRARKAICEIANRLFWKAGLLTCFQGNKKKNNCEVWRIKSSPFLRYKGNCDTRKWPVKFGTIVIWIWCNGLQYTINALNHNYQKLIFVAFSTLHNCLEFSQLPLAFRWCYGNTENVLYCLKIISS